MLLTRIAVGSLSLLKLGEKWVLVSTRGLPPGVVTVSSESVAFHVTP